jgi:hypothetical protein
MHGLQWDYSLIPATTREIENYAILESIFRDKKSAGMKYRNKKILRYGILAYSYNAYFEHCQ